VLFERDDRTVDFFLVLEGSTEISEDGPDGERRCSRCAHAVPADLSAEPEVAEIVMRAFVLRRAGFISHVGGELPVRARRVG